MKYWSYSFPTQWYLVYSRTRIASISSRPAKIDDATRCTVLFYLNLLCKGYNRINFFLRLKRQFFSCRLFIITLFTILLFFTQTAIGVTISDFYIEKWCLLYFSLAIKDSTLEVILYLIFNTSLRRGQEPDKTKKTSLLNAQHIYNNFSLSILSHLC